MHKNFGFNINSKLLEIFLVTICMLVYLCYPLAAHSESKQDGLQISPLRTRLSQKPGQTTTGQIVVANLTDNALDINLSVERFKTTDEDYHYDFVQGDNANWVRLADTSLTLKKDESRQVAYSLAIPANAPPGGYYFAIFASTTKNKNATSIQEIRRVASLIYLEVSGDLVHQVNLLGLDIPWLLTHSQITIQNRLANQGNTHEDIRLSQVVKPIIGDASKPIVKQGLILPGTIRKLPTTADIPPAPGIYKIIMTFSPPTGQPQTFTQTFVYLPLWVIPIFGPIIALLVLKILHSHARRRRKLKAATYRVNINRD